MSNSLDQEKIRKAIEKIDLVLKENLLNDKEYLVLVANFLYAFGFGGIKLFDNLKNININDSNIVETEYMKNPGNVYLAALLQSHALIKWSEGV